MLGLKSLITIATAIVAVHASCSSPIVTRDGAKRLIIFGDSLSAKVQNYPGTREDKSCCTGGATGGFQWSDFLQDKLGENGCPIEQLSYAIGGGRVYGKSLGGGSSAMTLVEEVEAYLARDDVDPKNDILVWLVGANDVQAVYDENWNTEGLSDDEYYERGRQNVQECYTLTASHVHRFAVGRVNLEDAPFLGVLGDFFAGVFEGGMKKLFAITEKTAIDNNVTLISIYETARTITALYPSDIRTTDMACVQKWNATSEAIETKRNIPQNCSGYGWWDFLHPAEDFHKLLGAAMFKDTLCCEEAVSSAFTLQPIVAFVSVALAALCAV